MEPGDADEWLLHAESDLNYARVGHSEPAILRNQVAFHTQQAVEKSLKAVLVHNAIPFPRTHDVKDLLVLMSEAGIEVPQELDQAEGLTRYAAETRYPGDPVAITA